MFDNAFGQMSLGFDMFGEEFNLAPAPEKKKAEKKKATDKPKEKVSKAKKGEKELHVKLPCTVYGSSFKKQILPKEGEEDGVVIESAELVKRLSEAGVVEVNAKNRKLFIAEDNAQTAYITNSFEIAPDDDTLVVFNDNAVTFAAGEQIAEFSLIDFDGKEADEISFGDLSEKIKTAFPQFESAKLYYDVEAGVVTLGVGSTDAVSAKEKPEFPVTVCVCGQDMDVTAEEVGGEGTIGDLANFISKDYSAAGLSVQLVKMKDNKYYTYLSASSTFSGGKQIKNAGAKTAKKQEKFPVDGTVVYLVFNGTNHSINKEMFDGKEKITKDDLVAYFKDKFAIFASAEKVAGINCYYDKDAKILTVDCTPGRRGASGAPSFSDYRQVHAGYSMNCDMASTKPSVYIDNPFELEGYLKRPVTCINGLVAVTNSPYYGKYIFSNSTAAYICDRSSGREVLESVCLKFPKIPKSVYKKMLLYFRGMSPNEAICRVSYNMNTGGFTLVLPVKQEVTHVTVANAKFMPLRSPAEQVVATFHSHNTMPAFFSGEDDNAEKDEIGIFGVVGRVDKVNPEVRVRAMKEGASIMLNPSLIFDVERRWQ